MDMNKMKDVAKIAQRKGMRVMVTTILSDFLISKECDYEVMDIYINALTKKWSIIVKNNADDIESYKADIFDLEKLEKQRND